MIRHGAFWALLRPRASPGFTGSCLGSRLCLPLCCLQLLIAYCLSRLPIANCHCVKNQVYAWQQSRHYLDRALHDADRGDHQPEPRPSQRRHLCRRSSSTRLRLPLTQPIRAPQPPRAPPPVIFNFQGSINLWPRCNTMHHNPSQSITVPQCNTIFHNASQTPHNPSQCITIHHNP